MARPTYVNVEDVKTALDVKHTARQEAQILRALTAAADAVDALCHRTFYPWTGTRYFDWPGEGQTARPWRLWLNQYELVSVAQLAAGGVTIGPGDYFLRPDAGPPYNRVEVDLDSAAAFRSGGTHQRAVAITGVYAGCPLAEAPAGMLAGPVDGVQADVTVTDSAGVGAGDLLRIDDERMIVAGRAMANTGVTLAADLAAVNSAVTLTVSSTVGAPRPGETVLISGERMLVIDAAGTTLVVRRAWDGSVLAAHASGAAVYAPRTLTVARGAAGTTAASHMSEAAVWRWEAPGLVRQLTLAEAISYGQQDSAGWARTAGAGDSEREVSGRGVAALREQVRRAFGRNARMRTV